MRSQQGEWCKWGVRGEGYKRPSPTALGVEFTTLYLHRLRSFWIFLEQSIVSANTSRLILCLLACCLQSMPYASGSVDTVERSRYTMHTAALRPSTTRYRGTSTMSAEFMAELNDEYSVAGASSPVADSVMMDGKLPFPHPSTAAVSSDLPRR